MQTDLFAQEPPQLEKLHSLAEKIEAMRNYCNVLLTETFDYPTLIKEAKKGLKMLPEDSIKARSMFYLFLGCGYENTRQFDSSVYYFNNCIKLAKIINRTSYEITALSRLNYVYDLIGNKLKREATIKRMIEIADTSTKPEIKELSVNAIAGLYLDRNDYENAIKYKLQEIELGKQALKTDSLTTDPINIGYGYSNVANLFNQIGQYKKALEYLNDARPYLKDRTLKGNESNFYTYLINAFLGLNEIDSARHYYSLNYQGMAGRDTIFTTLSEANSLFSTHFLERHEIDSAFKYAVESRRLALKSPEKTTLLHNSGLLGRIYVLQGKYKIGLAALNDALQNDFEFDKSEYAEIHKSISTAYAKLGKWDSAYAHFSVYSSLNDTLQNAAANKNIADAEAIYQNSEKRKEIAIKNIELNLAHKEKLWLLAGLSLLGVIVLLLIVIFRNKKKTADVLNHQNSQLQELNQQLDEANKTKAKLFSIIGHDLRSPISQVYQYLKIQQISPQALSEEEKSDFSKKIQSATGSLLESLEDLLIWSKSQMNSFKIEKAFFEIEPIINDCVKLYQLNFDAKKISCTIDENLKDVSVFTDVYSFQTIFRNLLQNAIKASPENSSVNVGSETIDNKLHLYIQNQGALFTQEDYKKRIDAKMDSNSMSGLGLRLVDELSQKSGLEIAIKNPNYSSTVVAIIFPPTAN